MLLGYQQRHTYYRMPSMWHSSRTLLTAVEIPQTVLVVGRSKPQHACEAYLFNQSINLYRAIVGYRGACYSAIMPNQREMS